ncbi:MAG: hypothetical protein ACI8RN_002553 [Glaciecola sp.]
MDFEIPTDLSAFLVEVDQFIEDKIKFLKNMDDHPRLSLTSTGKVVYTLKTRYRDGMTELAFDPVDFIARLAALVPKPRVNLTRFHGVLAPNHRWRGLVTPAKRGKGVSMSKAEVGTPASATLALNSGE